MSQSLEIQRDIEGDVLLVRLKGNITEDSQIEDVKQELKPYVVVDLKDVQRINSYGIRQWVNAMKDISGQVKELVFHRCPPPFVEQFNMISNFGGGGVVYSFYLPFYCESQDIEELVLYEIPDGKSPADQPELPEAKSEKCPEPMIFNDIEEEYFYFLQHQKGREVNPEIVKAIRKVL